MLRYKSAVAEAKRNLEKSNITLNSLARMKNKRRAKQNGKI